MRLKGLLKGCLVMICLAGLAFPTWCPAVGEGMPFPAYGTGPVEVRIYSDYFCPPCRALEPQIEPLLIDLLKKNTIRLIFVDTPYHKHTPLYARYFLYALKANNAPEHALKVRALLYEVSSGDVTTPEQMETVFKKKGIAFRSFDPKPLFERYNDLLKEDKINATPTLVILREGKKEKWIGGPDILKALQGLP